MSIFPEPPPLDMPAFKEKTVKGSNFEVIKPQIYIKYKRSFTKWYWMAYVDGRIVDKREVLPQLLAYLITRDLITKNDAVLILESVSGKIYWTDGPMKEKNYE